MTIRIGCYICHCGINIAYRVRVAEVAAFAGKLDHVVVSRDYRFMCSDPGQEMIEKDIQEYGLTRVVVASCSPRLHEKTFQGACKRAGINPYMLQMASVREQVSWVTPDEDEATSKAKTLVAAAINRVVYHQSLETREVAVHPDVLIVGGGIAGMQAALDIGNSGHRVYLVEKSTTIGGHMLQFDKTFPTLDCAACIGTPKMVDVAQHPDIHLFSFSQVVDLSGYIGNYTVTIRRNPRYIKEGICTGCGECTKVCQVSMPSEWDVKLIDRKAVYRAFPQAVPITFCIDKNDRAPCVQTCPAHVNVQGYIQLIRQKKYEAAVRLIMERIPLPGVLGRVCPHPCEMECRRKDVDAAVAIRDLKRFAADQIDWETLPVPPIEEKPQSVAIIGAGPAGLTAAHDLRLKGYAVTIFEALPVLGGMLRVGIPDYRLPSDLLDREIGYILRLGVAVETGKRLGQDFTLDDLKQQGFSAIFMGIGAHLGMKLHIPGESDAEGVMDAVQFLRQANLNPQSFSHFNGARVVVVGGGNVAIDAVRVSLRLGAASAAIVYRRTETEMPAYADEILGAKEEGVSFQFLTAPARVVAENGRVTGLECLKTRLGEPDEKGRRRPEIIPDSTVVIPCDRIVAAIGQTTDVSWNDLSSGPAFTRNQTLQINPATGQTTLSHVFAGGDAVSGPATVIEAIAAGHLAAGSMDRFLQGLAVDDMEAGQKPERPVYHAVPENLELKPRAILPHVAPDIRIQSFHEESPGLSEDQAMGESDRCLNCGGCCECMECVRVCEAKAIDHHMKPEELTIPVGTIILTTGYDVMNPKSMKQFGYGRYPNVFTSLEFERLSNATGPTGGKILMRDETGAFTRPPGSVAILHCIGSRDVNHHEYCSRVCCMVALKYTHLIKEKVGHDTEVYDFYIDMRCFGEGYEEFYRRCQEEGTRFIRGKVAEITANGRFPGEAGKLVAIAEDTLLGKRIRVPVDMVILCAAMEARKDAINVGRLFGVNLGADGFFLEEHPKLGPLNTATDGVFIAGACQSPKDIPDTVSQASGAAVKALSLATRGRVTIPSVISWIDPDVCAGCQICIGLCPYSAIEFDNRRQVSVVNDALCKGCGSCAGFCPSGAAQVRHFQKQQVFAEFDGLMDALYRVMAEG
jgi:heterodisulfide reductase subunit A